MEQKIRKNEENLIMIGFWYSKCEKDLPKPKKTKYIPSVKRMILNYLDHGKLCGNYKGWSNCRICKIHNGSTDHTDGIYVWPGGLSHYISEHNIALPDHFMNHIANKFLKQRDKNLYYSNNFLC